MSEIKDPFERAFELTRPKENKEDPFERAFELTKPKEPKEEKENLIKDPFERAFELTDPSRQIQNLQEDKLTGGQVAGSLALDIGGSVASQAVGYGLAGPTAGLSLLIPFFGGMGSNITAQMVAEGKSFSEISWGRVISSGFINLIPGAAVTKFARPIAREALKGGATGIIDVTLQKTIDEKRLPTAGEIGTYTALGSLFGTGAGALTKKIADIKSPYNKISEGIGAVYGMSPTQIDKVLLTSGKKGNALRNMLEEIDPKTKWDEDTIAAATKDFEARLIFQKTKNENMKITEGWTGVGGVLSELNPFLALSPSVRTQVFTYKQEIKQLENLIRKMPQDIQDGLNGKVELNASVRKYLDGEVDLADLPEDIKNLSWIASLKRYREVENDLYTRFSKMLSETDEFSSKIDGLGEKEKAFFLQRVKRAINDKKYKARIFKAFIPGAKDRATGKRYYLQSEENLKNRVWNPTSRTYVSKRKGEKSAYEELYDEIYNWQVSNNPLFRTDEQFESIKKQFQEFRKNPNFTKGELDNFDKKLKQFITPSRLKGEKGLVNKHISELIKMQATGTPKIKAVLPGNVERVLINHVPGVAESRWLGEVTEVGTRMRNTLQLVARAVTRYESDLKMINLLKSKNLISEEKTLDASEKVKSIGSVTQDFYASPQVNEALTTVFASDIQELSQNKLIRYAQMAVRNANSYSKAVKVIFNPPSYAVNFIGSQFSMLGMGITPLTEIGAIKQYGKNLGLGFSQSSFLRQIVKSAKKAKGKPLTSDEKYKYMRELEEYEKLGIVDEKSASIFINDIFAQIEKGKNPFGLFNKTVLAEAGAIYSAADIAARISVFQHNIKRLGTMFPKLASAKPGSDDLTKFKRLAAELTNDTYQNYGRISKIIRYFSQVGVMPQFVVFTAELTRNLYHQFRTASQMMRGTFGKQYGLTSKDIGEAAIDKMRKEGTTRMLFLTGVMSSAKFGVDFINRSNGISKEDEMHFRKNIAYPYQVNKQLLLFRDKNDPNKYAVMNASYLMPQAVPVAMLEGLFNGTFDEDNPRSFFGSFIEEFVGEGTFLGQNVYNVLANRDKFGKEITLAQKAETRFIEKLGFLLKETFEPGIMRELVGEESKLAQALRGQNYTVDEVIKRQLGFRVDKVDQVDSISYKLQDLANSSSELKQNYTRALRQVEDGKIDSETAEQVRMRSNQEMQLVHERISEMYQDSLQYSGLEKNKVDEIFLDKRANLSSDTKLRILNGLPAAEVTRPELTATEEYEQLFGVGTDVYNYSYVDIRNKIQEYKIADPLKYKSLLSKFKLHKRLELRKGEDPTIALLRKLNVRKRASMILELGLDNVEDLKALKAAGVVTPDVLSALEFLK